MNKIIYIDGALADAIGRLGIFDLGQLAANLAREPVDILTNTPSKYHHDRRFTFEPRNLDG